MPKKVKSCLVLPRRKEGEIRRVNSFKWPYRQGRSDKEVPIALRNAQTGDIDAVLVLFQPTAPTLRAQEWHQAKHAMVGPAKSSFGFPLSFIDSSSSSTGSTSAALQLASTALVTRSYGEARDTGPAFQPKTFALHDAPSYIDAFTKGRVPIGMAFPVPEGLPTTQPCGREQGSATPLETGSPPERSCVEAVMDCLDLGCPISEADVASMLSTD